MSPRIFLLLIITLTCLAAGSQDIKQTTPARLQVVVDKADGSQVSMTSEQLRVMYDNLQMSGELMIKSLVTDDPVLDSLLAPAEDSWITFTGRIPEGSFMFHDALEEKFSVETEITYGEVQSKFILDFSVSNFQSSVANSFAISASGSISLRDNLGVTGDTGLQDKVSFQFFQNVQVKTY
jgi:hypothetical protein